MFNRELYLESVLSQLSGKAGEDAYVSTLADVVLHAELDRGHRKAKDNNQDVRSRRKSVEVLTGLRANADRHVLLLGKPGSGKSTALKRLLREDAEKCLLNPELKIPVLLELRRLDTNTSIELLLAKALGVPRYRVKPENIADLLDSDDFLLLFDGLNELPSGTHWLTDWRKEFIHVPMIFSSRELGAETYLGIDVQLRMLPLTEDKARELIKKRLGDNAAAQMLQTLHGRLIALTDTPLLLDMLCSIYLTSQTIPQNQGDLFRKFTQEQYKKHKPSETVKPRHDDFFDFCDDFLQELASFMMSADGDGKNIWLQVSRNQAEKWLERRFKEREIVDASSKTKQWLDDALNLHLLQRATEQGNIEFSHQVFQEYYAAEWLLRYLNDFPSNQICANYLNKIKWTDVFCMLMGLLHDEEQGVKLIDLAFSVDANLAAKLTGATTLHFQEKAFRQLFNKINFFEHKDAFFLLSTNATDFAINYLAGLLKSDDPVVRVRASENLLNVVNPAAFFPLISALQDENEEVRACAASALGNIGDMRAYDALIIALRDDSSEVRSAAAFSLGELGSADAYDSLMLLLNDESPDVRESAIFALGGLGDQRAINDLYQW